MHVWLRVYRSDEGQCACPPTAQVHGDAFLARVFDNEDDFERLDFTLQEVSSSAPWVKVGHPSVCASTNPDACR